MTIPDVPEAGALPWLDRYTSTAGEIMIWAGISQSQLRNFAAEWERRCWPILAEAVGEVETLRAEVARLEGERDEARARANEAARLSAEARDQADDLRRVIADLREQVAIVDESRTDMLVVQLRLEDQCAEYRAESERIGTMAQHLVNRATAFRGERDAMRPVVEAAVPLVPVLKAWLLAYGMPPTAPGLSAVHQFAAAVDQMAPSTPPSTPESDGQGEVAVTDAVEAPGGAEATEGEHLAEWEAKAIENEWARRQQALVERQVS